MVNGTADLVVTLHASSQFGGASNYFRSTKFVKNRAAHAHSNVKYLIHQSVFSNHSNFGSGFHNYIYKVF